MLRILSLLLPGLLRDARAAAGIALAALLLAACGGERGDGRTVLKVSGSAVGREGEVLRRQIARFERLHPEVDVEVQQTPDDATQRHQLYVQWLNARVGTPDVLQLDVVWTPEFAAAGWILPLDRFGPRRGDFFPATVEANTWRDTLYALPWFADVGMLYWRTDLLDAPPATLDQLAEQARRGRAGAGPPSRGIVWQGARYEGLVTVFLEYLGAYGGTILTPDARVAVDSPEAVRALRFMRDQVRRGGIAPREVLTWHEEETRFAFQNGTAVFMRNWPYAVALLNDSAESRVAGRFAVAPMPAAPGGRPTAALGGAQLAINAHSAHPEAAYRLIEYLTAPEQMLERAAVAGQYPARPALYDDPRLARALGVPTAEVRRIVEAATPRPVTPIYTQLSEILQIHLHRALVGRVAPEAALRAAAAEMERVIEETGIREVQG
ncbi:MAG TPA: ABC transporter substrate-binding protein [Longimicrobiaceae bacterium]|nr:ABC transporter substrate-binding protein [Longimicrobiaceae bacterium]